MPPSSTKSRWFSRKRALCGAGIVILVCVVVVVWMERPQRSEFYTDADTIRSPVETALIRDVLWRPPLILSEVINTGEDDYEPCLSADGTTLFFVRGKAGQNADIYAAQRTLEGWREPQPLAVVNSSSDDLGPELSADGLALYFYSDRVGGLGGYDVWVSRRSSRHSDFGEAGNLGPSVNTGFNEYGPALAPDGGELYFASNRPRPDDPEPFPSDAWPATLREDRYAHDYDLFFASLTDRGAGQAQAVTALNTPYNEGAAAVSPVGDFLYFGSDRPGGEGGFDLYRSRRLHGVFQPSENLGIEVNTLANELDPALGMGGFGLHFSSDRPEAGPVSAENYNVYYTSSREVFAEVEERPAEAWAGLWKRILPNLLWALFALLLLLLLALLWREARARKMGLLAQCVLASLLAHLVLMLLFNFWEITASLAHMGRGRTLIQVALVPSAGGAEIGRQIRGDLTDIETPPPVERSEDRADPEVEWRPVLAAITLPAEQRPITLNDQPQTRDEATDAPYRKPEVATAQLALAARRELADLSTPGNAAPINATEPLLQPQSPPCSSEDRLSDHPVGSSQPFEDSSLATLPPQPIAHYESSESPSQLIHDSTPHDTAPTSFTTMTPPQQVLPVAVRTGLDLTVPAGDNRQRISVAEPRAALHAQATEPTHSTLSVTPSDSPDVSMYMLVPNEIVPIHSDQFPVVSTEHRTEDAAVTDSLIDSVSESLSTRSLIPNISETKKREFADRTDQVHLLSEINVPGETSPRKNLLEEPILVYKASTMQYSRRQPGETVMAHPDRKPIVEVTPERMLSDHGQSVAPPLSQEMVRDASVEVRLTDLTVARSLEQKMPALTEIATPSDGASNVLPPVEPESRVTAVRVEMQRSLHFTVVNASTEWASDDRVDLEPVRIGPPSDVVGAFRSEKDAMAMEAMADQTDIPDLWAVSTRLRYSDTLELRLPTETRPPADRYAQRAPEKRSLVLERLGGSEETERAVELALHWLAAHQSTDGHWDGERFDERCGRCGDGTPMDVDVALTGLSLLCFLASDHTHTKEGPYREIVEQGLHWLMGRQRSNGDLRRNETMYSHGIAAMALSEAYGMTGDERLADPVRRATRFICQARNTRAGGWRYDPGQAGDTSVLGWQIMALKSAQLAGIEVPRSAFQAAAEWLDRVSSPSHPGRYAYQPSRRYTPAMTAESMFTLQLLGAVSSEWRMQAAAEYLLQNLPDWQGQPNTYYWYYATLALYQHQGEAWNQWNETITEELLSHQHQTGRPAGSWDPHGEWAHIGGRIYQTAMCTLTLEVYYRYLPLYSLDAP